MSLHCTELIRGAQSPTAGLPFTLLLDSRLLGPEGQDSLGWPPDVLWTDVMGSFLSHLKGERGN